MKLQETIEMMNSEDFKDRFKATYYQLENWVKGLNVRLDKWKLGTLPSNLNLRIRC